MGETGNGVPLWGWIAFGASVLVLLAVDLRAHRGERGDSRGRAVAWTGIWIAAGLAFGGVVRAGLDGQRAEEYLAAYLIEKSLSLDNLFVFLVIFRSLGIDRKYQRKVLFWGIFGAVVFRGLFIFLGSRALEQWDWINYVFGAILIAAALRTLRKNPSEQQSNRAVRWLGRHLPVTERLDGGRFITRENGRRVITPLLLALLGLEASDVLFAIDSVPAAFSMTGNTFVVYSSNVFAILGLRALYIVVAHGVARMTYLHYGLALVLGFAGVKIVLHDHLHIPPLLSVGIICAIIGASVGASLWRERRDADKGLLHM